MRLFWLQLTSLVPSTQDPTSTKKLIRNNSRNCPLQVTYHALYHPDLHHLANSFSTNLQTGNFCRDMRSHIVPSHVQANRNISFALNRGPLGLKSNSKSLKDQLQEWNKTLLLHLRGCWFAVNSGPWMHLIGSRSGVRPPMKRCIWEQGLSVLLPI